MGFERVLLIHCVKSPEYSWAMNNWIRLLYIKSASLQNQIRLHLHLKRICEAQNKLHPNSLTVTSRLHKYYVLVSLQYVFI